MAVPNSIDPVFLGNITIGSSVKLMTGAGAPTGITAPKGSLYLNSTATTTTTRIYINSDGATTWVTLTTSA